MKRNVAAFMISVYWNDKLDYLQNALTSVFSQTLQRFDIYIQQDGPICPAVEAYLDELLVKGLIKYLGKRKKNMGLAFSLNELLKIIMNDDYQYIVRMDADDLCDDRRFEIQFSFMEENQDVDVLGSWIEEFDNENKKKQTISYAENHEQILSFFRKRCPMAHVSCFFRRTFFQKAGYYRLDTLKNEDLALWIDGLKKGCRFHNIQKVLVRVRINNNFFDRRGGRKKAFDDFRLKIEATRAFSFGVTGYMFAIGSLILLQLPQYAKKIIYQKMR